MSIVELVWATPDAEALITKMARVSAPANENNMETAPKLLRYLIKHAHWSPFEMASMCVKIETERDIAAQILRHRSFSFQEFSQRYADPVKDLNFVHREARMQDPKNRQNSIPTDTKWLQDAWRDLQDNVIREARFACNWAIENGIAKEQARAVLPEGITVSRMYVNGTLRSWLHYIELRSENGTQKEHREVAVECAKVISKVFPMVMEFVEK